MKHLEAGHIYYIDGGYFQAIYDELMEQFSLWAYLGLAGYVIGRTGFEIGPQGQLQARIFDFETGEHVVFQSRELTVNDQEEVGVTKFDVN